MANDLYAEAIPTYVRFLNNLKNILQKARQHVIDHKFDEAALLSDLLYPDMFPLVRQVQTVCDGAKGAAARLAGVEVPKHPDVETTFEQLMARIDTTLAFIEGIDIQVFEGSGERHIVLQFGSWRREFTGVEYLRTWALPNLYFHISTAYGLLRHNGVPLGKMDFLGWGRLAELCWAASRHRRSDVYPRMGPAAPRRAGRTRGKFQAGRSKPIRALADFFCFVIVSL